MPIITDMRRVLAVTVCLFTAMGCFGPSATRRGLPIPRPTLLGGSTSEARLLPPNRRRVGAPLPPIEKAYEFGPEVPNVSAPYRLKPGDVIEINIIGEDNTTKEVVIGPDGRIGYFSVVDLQVSGRTFEEVRRGLTECLKRDYINPRVAVTGSKYSGNTLTVMGVVGSPGQYEIREGMRLLEVLATAGGIRGGVFSTPGGVGYDIASTADLKRAILLRGKQLVPVDFGALLAGAPGDIIVNNVVVRSGDIIYIPSGVSMENKIFVLGMVHSPGVVRFTGSISFVEAIAEARGVPLGAWERRAYIVRGKLSSPTVIPINLRSILTGRRPDIPLSAGDIVFVPKTPLRKLDDIVGQIVPILGGVDTSIDFYDRRK